MLKKLPSFIRVKYNKKLLLLLLAATILLITAILAISILLVKAPSENDTREGIFPDLTNYILSTFNKAVSLVVRTETTSTPTPIPTTNLTPPLTIPSVMPKTLTTTNATQASVELSHAIFELKRNQLPSVTVEKFYSQGKDLLEKGDQTQALHYFKQGYDLAQEILLAGEYYRK